jgi:hypothetical protein
MEFAFEYVGVRYAPDFEDHRFFGRIVSGKICKGDSVVVPTLADEQIATISNFWDDMYDWLGTPFYDAVTKESVSSPFCVCVFGLSKDVVLTCPGVLRSVTHIHA